MLQFILVKNNKNKKSVLKNRTKIIVLIILVTTSVVAVYAVININTKSGINVAQQTDISIPNTSNTTNEMTTTAILLEGQFKDGDAVHSGSGEVSIVNSEDGAILVFGDDFKVTNGPDLLVYLSPNSSNEPLGEFASLGKLKSNTGEQAYNLPSNYSEYKTVAIWCRAFNITFATAELN